MSRATAGNIVVSLCFTVSSQRRHVVRFVRKVPGILLTAHFMLMRCTTFAAACFFTPLGGCRSIANSSFRSVTQLRRAGRKPGWGVVEGSESSTPTCVRVEDWEGAPEPKHHVHLIQPVGEDTEDEEECGGAKQEPDWKNQIWICTYKETQTAKHSRIVNGRRHNQFCIVCAAFGRFFCISICIYTHEYNRILRFPKTRSADW